MEIKVTKRLKLLEINNCMCHNFYYEIFGRVYNDEKTMYKKFRFVVWFDVWDLLEYLDSETYTSDDLNEYLNELIWSDLDYYLRDYEITDEFVEFCNETIRNYNDLISKMV